MNKEKKIRLADFLTQYLYAKGVRSVFMLSGTGSIHLDDAFAHQKGLRYICARHEAAATIMAEASAKLTQNIGVMVATTGPGGTNAIGGIVEAWVDSVPVLVISGQVESSQISKDVRSFGVQGFNVIENVEKVTKYAAQIKDPMMVRYHLEKALFLAKDGRPGPVWLDIPFDIQSKLVIPKKLKAFRGKSIPHKIKKDKIDIVFKNLKKAKKPVIIFGQGIRSSKSINIFKDLLKITKIPAISARMGLDILPYDYPYYFGLGGMRGQRLPYEILKSADLVIAIGTSYTHAFGGKNYNAYKNKAKFIMVNIDSKELNKTNFKPDMKIKTDLSLFITDLKKKILNESSYKVKETWLSRCKKLKKELSPSFTKKSNPINSYSFIDCLNSHTNSDHIFVNDAGSANYICSQALILKEGQRELTSGAFYSMGIAVPMAIGASVTEPTKQIIVITGDGSIELNIQELRTISLNKLNIKVFVINNGGYASIRKSQDDMVGGRYTDDEEVLNFKKISEAFEIPFTRISDYGKLSKNIPQIFKTKGPALIELMCDPKQEILEIFGA